MKIKIISVGIIFILFVFPLFCCSETLKFTILDYPPLIGKDIKGFGVEASIVTASFEKVNIKSEYQEFPPGRCYGLAKNGNYDGTVGWVYSEEREKSFYYSEPILKAPLVFFHLKNFKFNWETVADLKGIPIGIVVQNYYGPDFQKAMESGQLLTEEVAYDIHNYRKLLVGRIKLLPMNLYTGYYSIRQNFSDKAHMVTHHSKPLKTSVYHVLFPKIINKSKERAELFNKGLKKIKDSGEYIKIIESYKLSQEEIPLD